MENKYPMMIAVVLLLFFLIYKEIKRVKKAHLFIRMFAVFGAAIALAFLIYPLKYKVSRDADPRQLHLLTRGADPKLLKESLYFTTDSNMLLKSGGRHVTYIADLSYYLQAHQDLNGVQVYGYGLRPEELRSIKDYNYDFKAAPSPAGFLSCSWPRLLKKTELLNVQGIYNNTTDQPVRLMLEGLGSKLDSVSIKPHKKAPFSLRTEARQIGRALYSLTAFKGKDILEEEKIPFQVTEPPKVKLVVLSSFPDFEYKFLKNWLFDHKYQVIFRTRVSKDKFSIDQLNIDAVNPQQLTLAMLTKFDGVIADDDELSKLSPNDLNSLREAVNQGLGLLIRVNEEKPLSGFAKVFQFYTKADSAAKTFTPVFSTEGADLKALPANSYLFIKPRPQEQPLVKDKGGKVMLSTSLEGNGKIMASTITSTFNWVLTGNQKDYAQYWSRVINGIIRKTEEPVSWSTVPAKPVKGDQTSFIYQSALTNSVPETTVGQIKLSPVQNKIIPYVWQSTFWPTDAGWNKVKTGNSVDYLFVYDKKEWLNLRDEQTIMENRAYQKNISVKTNSNQFSSQDIEREISKWWFFALFLISAGYIWFETKML